jgi:cytochrome c-type biogenesis protein CcsB
MTFPLLDSQLFPFIVAAYAIAGVLYLVALVRRSEKLWPVASMAAFGGWMLQTASLALRWMEAGHPPWSNIYEMLLFVSWGMLAMNLLIERLHGFKFSGAVVLPLASVAMLVASLLPHKETGPLIPALQSKWIFIHVALAMTSYATFATAFAMGVLFLVKKGKPLSGFAVWTAGLSALLLGILDKGRMLATGTYRMSVFQGKTQVMLDVANKVPYKIPLPWAGIPLLIAFLCFLLATLLYIIHFSTRSERTDVWAQRIYFAGFIVQLVAVAFVVVQIQRTQAIYYYSNPFELAGIILSAGLNAFFFFVSSQRDAINERLPALKILDELQYRTITIGFPLLAAAIICGALWAQFAWGTWWGNDPKEWWALITWLVYAVYLHTRIALGWSGERSAYFSIAGFGFVLFTFLGVTYLLPGLHSYT